MAYPPLTVLFFFFPSFPFLLAMGGCSDERCWDLGVSTLHLWGATSQSMRSASSILALSIGYRPSVLPWGGSDPLLNFYIYCICNTICCQQYHMKRPNLSRQINGRPMTLEPIQTSQINSTPTTRPRDPQRRTSQSPSYLTLPKLAPAGKSNWYEHVVEGRNRPS